jgi:hypothetical protein
MFVNDSPFVHFFSSDSFIRVAHPSLPRVRVLPLWVRVARPHFVGAGPLATHKKMPFVFSKPSTPKHS